MSSPTRRSLQVATALQRAWVAQRNKLLNLQELPPTSTKKAWWRCAGCSKEFKGRVVDMSAAADERSACMCPQCNADNVTPKKHREPKVITDNSIRGVSRHTMNVFRRTDTRNINPMLAVPWETHEAAIPSDTSLVASPKLDGIRCVALFNQKLGVPLFMSRNGNIFESCDHISKALLPAFRRDPTLVLDGELYDHEATDFSAISSAVKVSRSKATDRHRMLQARLQYHAFDVMYSKQFVPTNVDDWAHAYAKACGGDVNAVADAARMGSGSVIPFSTRVNVVRSVLGALPPQQTVFAVRQTNILKLKALSMMDEMIEGGYEGLMVRYADSVYEFGKRSNLLLKCKVFQDAEYEIVGTKQGEGALLGCLGSVICAVYTTPVNGKRTQAATFNVPLSIPTEEKRRLWQLKRGRDLLGQMLTVQYQELTPAGVPRFPTGKAIRGSADPTTWV